MDVSPRAFRGGCQVCCHNPYHAHRGSEPHGDATRADVHHPEVLMACDWVKTQHSIAAPVTHGKVGSATTSKPSRSLGTAAIATALRMRSFCILYCQHIISLTLCRDQGPASSFLYNPLKNTKTL